MPTGMPGLIGLVFNEHFTSEIWIDLPHRLIEWIRNPYAHYLAVVLQQLPHLQQLHLTREANLRARESSCSGPGGGGMTRRRVEEHAREQQRAGGEQHDLPYQPLRQKSIVQTDGGLHHVDLRRPTH